MLLTGEESLSLTHSLTGGAGEGEVSSDYLWWPPQKVSGRFLAPYLAGGVMKEELEPPIVPLEVEVALPHEWHAGRRGPECSSRRSRPWVRGDVGPFNRHIGASKVPPPIGRPRPLPRPLASRAVEATDQPRKRRATVRSEAPHRRRRPGSGRAPAREPPFRSDETGDDPGRSRRQRRIEAAVRRYVAAIDAGDGAALCALLAPGALRGVDLPVRRGSCAASLGASIGHPSPGGSPRWLRTRLVDADSVVTIEGGLGRLTGTVVHRFAGSREPSIEDDVIYLRQVGGRWRIAKPSSTFYRAIGVRDVPIAALQPP